MKTLNLNNNKLSDIKVLEKAKFNNLEKLYLIYNQISNIKALEKAEFKSLKELNFIDKINIRYNSIRKSKV